MSTYEILVDGKPRKVELTKDGESSFTAKIDGKPATVQLQTGQTNVEKPFSLSINGKSHKIELSAIDLEKTSTVKVDGVTFKAELKIPTAKMAFTAFAPTQPTPPVRKTAAREQVAEGAITAPMTGKIVSVKIKEGDQVKKNQVLCVIEAMKMENEINAPKAGTILEVNVAQGASVSEGEVLLIIG
jgi:biotin carboxyl carrier protein